MKNYKFSMVLAAFCITVLGGSLFMQSAHTAPPGGGSPGGGPPPMPVEVAAVRAAPLEIVVSAVGSLGANEAVTIRPEVPGRIESINFQEGEPVKKGEVLIKLDEAEYRAQLAESDASLKLAEVRFERTKQLFQKNLASKQEFDQEAAQLDEARARRALDDQRLRKAVLRAPFDGILGLRRVSPGDYVKAGDDIVDLADISALKLDFQVPEIYLKDVKSGQQVSIQVDARQATIYMGQVYAIAPRLDTASRSVLLRARVPNNGDLRPGMFARVKLQVASRDQAILVPEQALWPVGNDQFVYHVVDGKAMLAKVVTGHRQSGDVEILSGINAGDTVVTAGQMKIRDGAAVMPLNTPKPQQ